MQVPGTRVLLVYQKKAVTRIAPQSHRHLGLQLPELFLFVFLLGMSLSLD
jgi:hypothetical protein